MFSGIVNLVVKCLSIIYCGPPIFTLHNYNAEEGWSSVALHFQNITSLKLSEISVENSTGYGIIMGSNILASSSVSHSRFVFSNYYNLSSKKLFLWPIGSHMGGNMLLFLSRICSQHNWQ